MAGKQGRCKQCGQQMTVPKVTEAPSKAAKPELAAVGAGIVPGSNWLGAVQASQVVAGAADDRSYALPSKSRRCSRKTTWLIQSPISSPSLFGVRLVGRSLRSAARKC